MPSIVNATTTAGVAVSGDNSGVLALQTNNGTTAVTIDTSQNVGIGTASPGAKVEISGTAAAQNLALRITNTATDGYSTLQLGGSGDGGVFRNGSAQSGYAGASSLNLITVGAHPIGLATGNTIRAIIPAAGGLQVVGSISVGNATPTTSGAGITFPASQSASSDANTLDDYEEGTWTPAYGGGANITGTPTFSQAVYTKVGRLVTISLKSVVNTTTGNTNTYIVATGLPFTIANVMALYSVSNNNVRVGIGQAYGFASLFIQYPAESGLPSGSDDWYSTLIYYV